MRERRLSFHRGARIETRTRSYDVIAPATGATIRTRPAGVE